MSVRVWVWVCVSVYVGVSVWVCVCEYVWVWVWVHLVWADHCHSVTTILNSVLIFDNTSSLIPTHCIVHKLHPCHSQLYTHTHTHTHTHHTLGAEYGISSDGFFELEDLPKYVLIITCDICIRDHRLPPLPLCSSFSPPLYFSPPSLSPPSPLPLPLSPLHCLPPPSLPTAGKRWWLAVGTLLWS